MINISDIIAILDKIPIWKTLKEMPKKIEELEKRVAALEAKKPARINCLQCGSNNYKIEDTRTTRRLGKLMTTLTYTCQDCSYKGMTEVPPEALPY
jgi:DNA-directed RNA polymerase subunit M/transcription elongation factor TFIIS